jgi:uncharacterized membrane protein YdbT with pleckstrin-like domain
MADRTIHPSMKAVWAGYLFAILVIVAGVLAYRTFAADRPPWLMAIPCLLLLLPLRMQMKRRLVTLRLQGDHLTLETGFFSRTRRTFDMAKVQDVTVRQSFGQRLLGVGDVMLETAGESGRIAILNVDSPRDIADVIIAGSRRTPGP